MGVFSKQPKAGMGAKPKVVAPPPPVHLAYYNEHDKYAAAWLENLGRAGLITKGIVDERDIQEVTGEELLGGNFTRAHFFAGIGGWEEALRLAGWPEGRPVWTGSCPCQPFSVAGKGRGEKDERHLWPDFMRLIRECRPHVIFGEQVESAVGHGWLDGIFGDLEAEGYTCGAVVLGAHSVGAPHIRQRLFWVAYRHDRGSQAGWREDHSENGGRRGSGEADPAILPATPELRAIGEPWRAVVHGCECDEDGNCPRCDTDFSECGCPGPTEDDVEYRERWGRLFGRRMVLSGLSGLEGHAGHGDDGDQPGRVGTLAGGSASEAGGGGDQWLSDAPSGQDDTRRPGDVGDSSGSRGCGDHATGDRGRDHGTPWSDFILVPCRDGKARRLKPGIEPLAHGVPGRVGQLRAYGNAIVPATAAEFIKAFLEWEEAQ